MTTTEDIPASASTAVETPVYVYGVVRAGALGVLPVEGVAGRPVGTIDSHGLAAVTSELTEERLRVRRRDLLGHLRVLEAAFAETTVVPCAFGMVVAGRQAVETDVLEARRAELLGLLGRLDGREQFNVTAAYDEQVVLREIVESEPEIARLRAESRALGDAAHFASIRLGELVASALAQRRADDAQRVIDALAAESDDLAVESTADLNALKASFLVARDRSKRFHAVLDGLAAADAPRLRFASVGPLPPTAFATLNQGG